MYPAPDSDKVLHKKPLRCISLVIAWWSEVFCLVLRGAICKVLPSGYLTVCHGIDGPIEIDGLPVKNCDFPL